ncbi:MFS transporter [Celeribacter litoreus]|uniref:MFS transporter n=1 Tax=Celeribacter litoreus TaxID=2876714 RepID=UPI001CCA260D|nr:MFS transporter [Celeribacter litoreus]
MTRDVAHPRFLIFLLWLTGVLAAGQFAKVSVTFDLVRDFYPGYGPSLGFVVSCLSFAGLMLGLLAGLLLVQLGFKRLLLWALLLGGAMSLLQSTILPFEVFLATRLIEGLSHLVIVVAAPTIIAQISPQDFRNTAMALWSTVFAVSFALFSFIGLPFTQAFGLPALFIIHACALWGMAAVLWRVLPTLNLPQRGFPSGRQIMNSHLKAYRSARIAAPAAGWIFYAGSFVALVTVIPDFLESEQRAFYAGIMPVSALVISLTLAVFLLRFWSPVRILIIGFLSAVICAAIWGTGAPVGPVAILMLGGLGLVQAGSFASIPFLNAETEDQALAQGAVAQAGNFGNMLGTPLLLLLVELFGKSGLIGFAFCAFLAGAVVHLWLAQQRRRAY